jgi:excisionase family DNA binding protein
MTEYLTTDDAARYLRIAKRTVYYLIETGSIKPIQAKKRGRIRFTVASLDAYANPTESKQ